MIINNGSNNDKLFYGMLVFFAIAVGSLGYFIMHVR